MMIQLTEKILIAMVERNIRKSLLRKMKITVPLQFLDYLLMFWTVVWYIKFQTSSLALTGDPLAKISAYFFVV